MVSELSTATSISLIDRVRRQDPESWNNLLYLYGPMVFHWCRRRGLNDHDAADVGQEVFRRVFTAVDKFRRDRATDTFRGWLRVITENQVKTFRSRHFAIADGGSAHLEELAAVPDERWQGDDQLQDEEDAQVEALYKRAMDLVESSFQPQSWHAFRRLVVDGCSVEVVASELGMTEAAVRKVKSRVLKRLRLELDA